jgi:hypothetical protein
MPSNDAATATMGDSPSTNGKTFAVPVPGVV